VGETYTITDLAEEFRVTPRTIRFYEDKELLHPERQGLNRVYSRRDRVRLQLILRGKRLGFSLAAIKEMLDLYDLGDGQVEQLRVTMKRSHERLAELERQRRDIIDAIKELKDGIQHLEKALAEKGVNSQAREEQPVRVGSTAR
jgi:DNA-binding transcriptional MerR regulator